MRSVALKCGRQAFDDFPFSYSTLLLERSHLCASQAAREAVLILPGILPFTFFVLSSGLFNRFL